MARAELTFRLALLVLAILATHSRSVFCQSEVKICPPEPSLRAGESCPTVCNDGCSDGVCRIRNPTTNVTCPDNLPCIVVCEKMVNTFGRLSCNGIDIRCSQRASCDIFFYRLTGSTVGVDCANTTHSCATHCDSQSSVAQFRCSNSSACNCQNKCSIALKCTQGYNCLGDPCYRKIPSRCQQGIDYQYMVPFIHPDGSCGCQCKDSSLQIRNNSLGSDYTQRCEDANNTCSSDSDCGFPIRGRCDTNYGSCVCSLPYSGVNCSSHLCPQCRNGAVCKNSTSPCICTGLWTGPNCTDKMQLRSSVPNISEHAERCNTTAVALVPAADMTPAASIPCPYPCTYCFQDDEGTPVCWINLPIPNQLFTSGECPRTHRCVVIFPLFTATLGSVNCRGTDFPCDLIRFDDPSTFLTNICNSSSSCRMRCDRTHLPASTIAFASNTSTQRCSFPNGSCICESSGCTDLRPCIPGATCNGDPCSGVVCPSDRSATFNAFSGQCVCSCLPFYYETNKGCFSLSYTRDCPAQCLNGGICRDAKCYCPPGWSGTDCSVRDQCVALSTASTCPTGCDWCEAGSCFIILGYYPTFPTCPAGWPCVFICDESCSIDQNNPVVRCPNGAGPCHLWCWGFEYTPLSFSSLAGEPRHFSRCTLINLICEPGSLGCTASCTKRNTTDPYFAANAIRSIRCGSTNVTQTGIVEAGSPCTRCGSDSCVIGQGEPCYIKGNWSDNNRWYGYLPPCPTDLSGQFLQLSSNPLLNTCSCDCGTGNELRNGSCSALGCNPSCKNLGICESALPGNDFRCRCVGGWTGMDCSSRCFFPVNANVTLCDDGLYKISGELNLPANKTVDLSKDVPDLTKLEIDGSVSFQGQNSTLSVVRVNGTLVQSVNVTGNWFQTSGGKLLTSVVISDGIALTPTFNINGNADFSGGIFEIVLSTADIIRLLQESNSTSMSVSILSYGSLQSQFQSITINDISAGSTSCRTLKNEPKYSAAPNGGRGALAIIFTLDSSKCTDSRLQAAPGTAGTSNTDESVRTVAIVLGILIPLAFIAAGGMIYYLKRRQYRNSIKAAEAKLAVANFDDSQAKAAAAKKAALKQEKASWKRAHASKSAVEMGSL